MLKSVTVINYKGQKTIIELRNPEKSGFLITDISGLGPGKATINMTEISSYDGAVYNSSRLPTRNITISFRYLWSNTIEDTRYASYDLFPLRKKVKLIFETDKRRAAIDGYVESNEPVIFDKESHTQVSIICENPYFYSYENNGTQIAEFSTIEPEFEFETEFPQNVGQEFSALVSSSASITYQGDVDTGFDLYLRANEQISNLIIENEETGEFMELMDSAIEAATSGPAIMYGDEIYICTRKGYKQATLTRNGNVYNILNALGRNPSWLVLRAGSNTFGYSNADMDVHIEYQVLYEGV